MFPKTRREQRKMWDRAIKAELGGVTITFLENNIWDYDLVVMGKKVPPSNVTDRVRDFAKRKSGISDRIKQKRADSRRAAVEMFRGMGLELLEVHLARAFVPGKTDEKDCIPGRLVRVREDGQVKHTWRFIGVGDFTGMFVDKNGVEDRRGDPVFMQHIKDEG